mmetsp:Transcript_14108/g.28510  ORF Transcript_14108/g.28510 Transcript_14108/m.28510 type:complete len:256 (-) Transcript_14108:406-1173(-)
MARITHANPCMDRTPTPSSSSPSPSSFAAAQTSSMSWRSTFCMGLSDAWPAALALANIPPCGIDTAASRASEEVSVNLEEAVLVVVDDVVFVVVAVVAKRPWFSSSFFFLTSFSLATCTPDGDSGCSSAEKNDVPLVGTGRGFLAQAVDVALSSGRINVARARLTLRTLPGFLRAVKSSSSVSWRNLAPSKSNSTSAAMASGLRRNGPAMSSSQDFTPDSSSSTKSSNRSAVARVVEEVALFPVGISVSFFFSRG